MTTPQPIDHPVDERQRRIHEDLTGVFRGGLAFDAVTTSLHAVDASLYRIKPLGVAAPWDADDVVTLSRYAEENSLPLIPRGAGSGLTGGSLGSGLIVDFSRHMNRIEEIEADTVTVQPGVVRNDLNRKLREQGRYFAPDPAMGEVTTVGGMLGVDAAGSHATRVGSTRDHVTAIDLVLAGGHTFAARRESLEMLKDSLPPGDFTDLDASLRMRVALESNVKRKIVSRLVGLLADNREDIRDRQPPLVRNACGYFLRNVLSETHLDLPRMLVGSEGTLGLFTGATLQTIPLPAHRGVSLLLFGRLEDAVGAVQQLMPLQPSACDLFDRRVLSLGRDCDPRFESIIPAAAEAGLLIEQTGFSDRQVRDRMGEMIRAVRANGPKVVVAGQAYEPRDVEFLWSLPQQVVPKLSRIEGTTRPQPFVEDIAVPPEAMHELLVKSQKVFQNKGVTATLYAHAATGQVHFRPFLSAPRAEHGAKIEAIARDLYQIVIGLGGVISGEHGDGLSRTSFIRSQYGSLYRVFQQIKDLFDPHNLLNPGKIVSDNPHLTVEHLRPPLETRGDIQLSSTEAIPAGDEYSGELVPLQLAWDAEGVIEGIAKCNGCGFCKTHDPESRMCPFHRVAPSEANSPRAHVTALRDHLSGLIDGEEYTGPEMANLNATCFNCKQCELECTSHVPVPQMVIEAKAAHIATNGLSKTDWVLSRGHSFGRIGSVLSLVLNPMLANPLARWLIEKLFGIARKRKLPAFASRPFLRTASQELLKKPPLQPGKRSVLYFVDHYANSHDPELARAFIAILKHNGYEVFVPTGQTGSGMAMISAGDLEAAREVAEQNLRVFADFAREGWPILCTEPSAALCLSREYPAILDHPDVEVVARQVREAGEFLQSLHAREDLRTDFFPLKKRIGYHVPCHLRALGSGTPLRTLVDLIPDLEITDIEKGCSGMAGTFGLSRHHFETSLEIGAELIDRMGEGDLQLGITECSGCKMQMEQGTPTATVHPLKLLAYSYGLMPEIEQRFAPSKNTLVIT